MKICIFGGSFDPIHRGHMIVAENARKQMEFDKVLFCPIKCSPHKKDTMFSFRERLDMIDAAIKEFEFEDWAEASPIEMYNDSNYTADLIPIIREHYKVEDRIYWLLGAEQFESLHTWYNFEYLNNNLFFCVYPRPERIREIQNGFTTYDKLTSNINIKKVDCAEEIIVGDINLLSSSYIRNAIKNKLHIPIDLSLSCYEKFIHNLKMNEVIKWFNERGITISTAESCTAGGIASLLADGKGASDVLKCGYITYSTESKTALLGVNPDIIKEKGVVSSRVALEMARGCRKLTDTTVAISITGYTEPLDAYIGISTEQGDMSFHIDEKTSSFGIHSRNVNRKILAEHALWLAYKILMTN